MSQGVFWVAVQAVVSAGLRAVILELRPLLGGYIVTGCRLGEAVGGHSRGNGLTLAHRGPISEDTRSTVQTRSWSSQFWQKPYLLW